MGEAVDSVVRRIWKNIRRVVGSGDTVIVEVLARRQGRFVRVPVEVRADDVERLYRKRY